MCCATHIRLTAVAPCIRISCKRQVKVQSRQGYERPEEITTITVAWHCHTVAHMVKMNSKYD